MTLNFAYGSNMSRAAMRHRCPHAVAFGVAMLDGWRFVVTTDGYASVVRDAGERVHGVLWQLSPRDLAALNAYENLDGGLYRRVMLPVRHNKTVRRAMVYLARERGEGRAVPGYMEVVIGAARDWKFPPAYVKGLERWAPSAFEVRRAARAGDVHE